MDRQTVIGFILIFLILMGSYFFNKPTAAQLEEARRQDSIAMIQAELARQEALVREAMEQQNLHQLDAQQQENLDIQLNKQFGAYAALVKGENQHYTFENDLMELTMASKGGRIASVRLKDYVTGDSLPLILFDEETSEFAMTLITHESRVVRTSDLFFEKVESANPMEFIFRLNVADNNYLDFVYTLQPDNYMLNFDVRGQGLENMLSMGTNSIDIDWNVKMRAQERGRKFANRYAMLQYKYEGDDVEKLSEAKDSHKDISSRLSWVAFKDQFFAAVFINKDGFSSNELSSQMESEQSPYIKSYMMRSQAAFNMRGDREANFQFYFGPSKYDILKSYDKGVDKEARLELDRLVPLGGNIIRWVSTWLVLPMFKFFGKFIGNAGIIIMLMTLCIKILIFPLTYKSLMSSTKTRLLKPQIDAINAKYPGDSKAAERSQATMDLYKKAGVNPMGGCVPMLLQFPVLIAMFWFFPASIELRQESFLWAQDLSTYDAIISWKAHIPLISGLLGNHISLFCLLMTVTNILSTKISSAGTDNSMPGMKMMMYMMPVMFLFIFNQYAAGLSFYYFFSSLLTIAQTYLFRLFINEDKIKAQMVINQNKPVKKSAFQQRLEEAQKYQREQAKLQAKKRK